MKRLLLILLCLPFIGFGQDLDLKSETAIRQYFDNNGALGIEGIWELKASNGGSVRVAIIKKDYLFIATRLTNSNNASIGDFKASFEPSSTTDEVFSITWVMANKTKNKTIGTLESEGLIKFNVSGYNYSTDCLMIKLYPSNKNKKSVKNGEWQSNGSGIIISKSGYIVTNYHVIEDANDIEVEFILDAEVQKFNAEIVQSDKVNDLAVIKIVDVNFDGVKELPYNFKTRSSDVGTKVYAFGYPMALSLMGKEIKVTDGIISSKTGFEGDITTYQISAPIQGGNSGGPLFDDKGNFIGINSSGINKKLADNVGYSIKTSYVLNLIDILPKSIDLPSNKRLASLPLTEQIKEITKYVVLVKVK